MKVAHVLRLAGASAALGGALRVVAAFIPPAPGNPALELLYFIIDLSLLFGLFGIYAAECERLSWLGLIGFLIAATGLAAIVGPDADIADLNIYATASAVIGIGLAVMSIAMLLWSRFPRWIPALWIGSLVAGLLGAAMPDKAQATLLIAGVLFALGFLGAGVFLFSKPTDEGDHEAMRPREHSPPSRSSLASTGCFLSQNSKGPHARRRCSNMLG